MLSKYQLGFKYCTSCAKWYSPDFPRLRCDVCNRLLRMRPHSKQIKKYTTKIKKTKV